MPGVGSSSTAPDAGLASFTTVWIPGLGILVSGVLTVRYPGLGNVLTLLDPRTTISLTLGLMVATRGCALSGPDHARRGLRPSANRVPIY